MAFDDWTGSLLDAPQEVIEAAIQKALNGAPTPHISPYDAMLYCFVETSPEYRTEYTELYKLYVSNFADSDQIAVNEYGFSTWESSHPLINDMTRANNKFHWYHMKPIVKRIERNVRIQELDSGRHFSQKDRLELISTKAYDEQDYARHVAIGEWRASANAARNREFRRSEREIFGKFQQTQQSKGVIDWFLDYNRRNPLTVGLVGASIYHKLKDAFGNK